MLRVRAMGTVHFIPGFFSTYGEVIGAEKDLYRVLFKNLSSTFLGFYNPQDNFMLDPNINCRLLGAKFEILQVEKFASKGEILVLIRSIFPLGIGRKIGRLFIKDDRFLVHSRNFYEELKKTGLANFENAQFLHKENKFQIELNATEKSYRIPALSTPLTDFNEQQIEKLLLPDPEGSIYKFCPIQHETLFLVSDVCLSPQALYSPLLHQTNSAIFDVYKESCYRQKISFSSHRGLKSALETEENIVSIFSLTPAEDRRSALFLSSMNQLKEPISSNWISVPSSKIELPPVIRNERHHDLLDRFIKDQPESPIFDAINHNEIQYEGALFVTYLPSFFLRGAFFQKHVLKKIKRIYFLNPSKKTPGYFSHADRSFLLDLNAHGIEVFWFDRQTNKLLQFCERVLDYTGIFLPPHRIEEYHKALSIGIYGSSCVCKDIEKDIRTILTGLEEFKKQIAHPLLNPTRPLAVSTGGGPGVMGIANKVAYDLNILSIAHLCNFSFEPMNPYLDGKMTYRIEKMIERQAEFLVKLPIFFIGGYGTYLELSLEIVGRQVGSYEITPILLFGEKEYWEQKITSRFMLNAKTKTLRAGEALSNLLIQVNTGEQALETYKLFFSNQLKLGVNGRIYPRGFRFYEEIFDDV